MGDIDRGLDTLIDTGSPALGFLDAIFGEDPDNPADINRDTDVEKLGVNIGVNQQTQNIASQETEDASTLTGGTTLTDNERLAAGQQVSSGTTEGSVSTGAFTGESGIGSVGFDPETGAFSSQISDPFAQNQNASLNASNQAFGALSGGFDDTLAQRFNALEALQEQDRIDSQLRLEDRLFSQGRLGSTGGGLQQNALLDAIAQQQKQNQVTAFDQATTHRDQLANEATAFSQNALQPEQLSLQQLSAVGNLAPQLSSDTVNQTVDSQSAVSDIGVQDSTAFSDTSAIRTGNQSAETVAENIDISRQQANEEIRTI